MYRSLCNVRRKILLKEEYYLKVFRKFAYYSSIIVLIICLIGCAANQALKKGEIAAEHKDWDSAVLHYSNALRQEPDNAKLRLALETARRMASHQHLTNAKQMMEEGKYDQALLEFRLAVDIDPQNQLAAFELDQARKQIQKMAEEQREKSRIEKLKEKVEKKPSKEAYLLPRSVEKISLNFPDKSVKEIYRYLGGLAGINILFDPAIVDQRKTFQVSDLTFMEALDALTQSSQHFYKIVNESTIIIAPNTPVKRRQYEEQIIKSYFISNADAKEVATQIRALIGIRNVAQNLQLNSITLRDTVAKIALADKIVERLDKAKAEVIIDLEILEVNRSKFNEFGVLLSNYGIIQTLNQEEKGIPLHRVPYITQADWFLSIPSFAYNLLKKDSNTKLLAKPQLRISEGEKSKLFIGESVPIRITTFNPAQTIGGNVVPIDSYQYRDVGINIEITPQVHHDNNVTLELVIKIDAILGEVTEQPIFTSRIVETKIRLANGETNLLAGLIKTEKRESLTGIPGLSSIPILGKAFSNTKKENIKTDLVITMTPHILRTSEITEEDLKEIWAGTEQNLEYRGAPPATEISAERPVREIPPESRRLPIEPELAEEGREEEMEETPPSETMIYPAPSTSTVLRDKEFMISIQVSQAAAIGQIEFELFYNSEIIEGIEARAGDFMQQDGTKITFEREFSQEMGLVRIKIARLADEKGATGNGSLVVLRFRSLATGVSPLDFSFIDAYNPESQPIQIRFSNGRVEVR
jgi:general secretion pathway protein D